MSNVLCRLAMLLLVAAFPLGAVAQQQKGADTGAGLLCDTAEQVEQYVAAAVETRSAEVALQRVNDKAGSTACAVASVLYIRGAEVKRVNGTEKRLVIVQITIIGSVMPFGIVRITPAVQYTVFEVPDNEREA